MADYTNPNAPVIPNPINLDKAIADIQSRLITLDWLDVAYGRVFQRRTKELIDTGSKEEPHVYVGNGQYQKVLANDNFKSQSFIFVRQPERVIDYETNYKTIKKEVDISIIFWLDLRKIFPNEDYIAIELLKSEIEQLLTFTESIMSITRIWDDAAKDIYRGFDVDELGKELLLYPYKALRYDCQISFETFCE